MAKEYYAIESGISMPDIDMSRSKMYYPWEGMEVGDSFLVKKALYDTYKTAASAASHRGIKHKEKYATRYLKEGLRIWRVK